MKKIFLVLVGLFLMSNLAQATHMLGGEISWKCLANGKFIFFLDVYRDCRANTAGFPFVNHNLSITGGALPTRSNGSAINSITMKPDSNRWMNANMGDITPQCQNPNGLSYSCASGDNGAVQWFPFQSDPIEFNGTPPTMGWTFLWSTSPCCRPGAVENLANAGGKSMGLRAIMYPISNTSGTGPAFLNVNPCIDSSPEFSEKPANQICRGYEFTYNHNARDQDLDSLIYIFAEPLNIQLQPIGYNAGYSRTNPLPDQNFNSANLPANLNPLTGEMKQAIYNGTGAKSYVIVVQVNAWRCGRVIASVFREMPFVFFDCDPLPGGKINNPPIITIDGQSITNYSLEVFAGEKIQIGFQARDNDLNPTFSPPFQNVTLEPTGFLFSKNFADDQFCETVGVRPCATLIAPPGGTNNGTPIQTPGNPYQLTAQSGISTQFNWQTDCNHISVTGGACGNGSGVAGAASGIFNFVMKSYDDNCPLRSINYPTISIKVKAPVPLIEPILKGASIGLDGKTTVSWVPPIDSANTFEEYDIDGASPNNNQAPGYLAVQSAVKNYQQDKEFQFIGFPFNLYTPSPGNKDYYFRMMTFSGCTGDIPSPWSESVRVIEVEADTTGPAPFQKSVVTLTWNRPKPTNAATNPNYIYESRTRFYIHENLKADDNSILTDPSKWTVVGNTYGTTFTKGSSVCDDLVGFRIEARDTVITYEQGSRINVNNPTFDTLYFSTFSIIDAIPMQAAGNVTAPTLDSLVVLANGDVFFKIDLASAPIAGTFNFYTTNGGVRTKLGSINAPNSTFTHSGANAVQTNAVVNDYEIQAINQCNSNDSTGSGTLNAKTPTGSMVQNGPTPCDVEFRLIWTAPTGMVTNGITYKVFQKTGLGSFLQIAGGITSLNYVVPNISGDTDYEFYVVAVNTDNDIFISEVFQISIPPKPSKEVLPAPNVRCVSVLENGNVKIEWTPWGDDFDTTNIFAGYIFRYRVVGSSVWLLSNVTADTTVTTVTLNDAGLNAQTQHYEFEVVTLRDGCSGIEESVGTYQTIFLDVVSDASNFGQLSWTPNGIASLNGYEIWRDEDNTTGYNKDLKFFSPFGTNSYEDTDNSAACNNVVYYYTRIQDELTSCFSFSNIASDLFEDPGPPEGQLIDYVTVDRVGDSAVLVTWSDKVVPDVESLKFVVPHPTGVGFETVATSLFDISEKEILLPLSVVSGTNTINLDGNIESIRIGVQAIDACGYAALDESRIDWHSTIFVTAYWDPCDSVVELSWNPYTDFHNGTGVEYDIWYDTTGLWSSSNPRTTISGGTTTDTTFRFKIEKDYDVNRPYHFYIKADQTGSGRNFRETSRSNRISIDVIFEGTPEYTYTHYANVVDDNQVELQVLHDETVLGTIGKYIIKRGTFQNELYQIGSVANDAILGNTFRYTDFTAETNVQSYYYQVVAENKCGGPVDTSNFGTSIFLNVQADNEALTNTLHWNEYKDWDSTVAFYNVYRSFNNGGFSLHEVVAPSQNGSTNLFVDDVYDEVFAIGDFCYMVEAVQGPITTDFGIDQKIDPAISRSNEVCVVQEPLFYIPNAFAPNGVNKVFGPQGQFLNWAYYEMIIYNRYGESVYESNDPSKGWDGKVNGKDPQIGSYVYTIRFKDANGIEHRRKGSVTIVQ